MVPVQPGCLHLIMTQPADTARRWGWWSPGSRPFWAGAGGRFASALYSCFFHGLGRLRRMRCGGGLQVGLVDGNELLGEHHPAGPFV